MPRLSVVIPSRDTRELTLRCLESLLGSEASHRALGGPPEILVVDEASRDGTVTAIGKRFPTVRVLENDRPRGFSAAANRGLADAGGEILLLLNSDTEVDPGALAALLQSFEEDPGLGVAGGRLRYPDGESQWSGGRDPGLLWLFGLATGLPAALGRLALWRRLRPPAGSDDRGGAPRTVDWVTGAALALRREVWSACGPLDEGYGFYAQDLDLCGQSRAAGWRVAIVPGFTVLHHHGASLAAASGDPGGGDSAGAEAGLQRFDLLWPDLVRWRAKTSGIAAGRTAAQAFVFGGALRLAARRAAAPLAGRRRRRRWQQEAVYLRRAVAACARTVYP